MAGLRGLGVEIVCIRRPWQLLRIQSVLDHTEPIHRTSARHSQYPAQNLAGTVLYSKPSASKTERSVPTPRTKNEVELKPAKFTPTMTLPSAEAQLSSPL